MKLELYFSTEKFWSIYGSCGCVFNQRLQFVLTANVHICGTTRPTCGVFHLKLTGKAKVRLRPKVNADIIPSLLSCDIVCIVQMWSPLLQQKLFEVYQKGFDLSYIVIVLFSNRVRSYFLLPQENLDSSLSSRYSMLLLLYYVQLCMIFVVLCKNFCFLQRYALAWLEIAKGHLRETRRYAKRMLANFASGRLRHLLKISLPCINYFV